jgi:hypothetical protein
VDLKLGSKGFFMTIFNLTEDRERVFQNGPYFFNSTGLYVRIWKENFSPEKEDFMTAPVWIHLYSLPQEYWHPEILEGIGNTLGSFVRIADTTLQGRYTSYARICVYLDVSKVLPASISLRFRDIEWIQTIDYEHIPFRCASVMPMDICLGISL